MVDLEKMNVLVVGGGKIALRKTTKLLEYGARVDVLAKDVCEGIHDLAKNNEDRINICEMLIDERFDISRLNNYDLIYLATNSNYVNDKLSEYCRNNNVLVNSVDDHTRSTFINTGFTSKEIDGDEVVFSVSCLGKNPSKTKNLIDKIKKDEKIW